MRRLSHASCTRERICVEKDGTSERAAEKTYSGVWQDRQFRGFPAAPRSPTPLPEKAQEWPGSDNAIELTTLPWDFSLLCKKQGDSLDLVRSDFRQWPIILIGPRSSGDRDADHLPQPQLVSVFGGYCSYRPGTRRRLLYPATHFFHYSMNVGH